MANEIARRLVERFGTLGDVLAARPEERKAVSGYGPEVEQALQNLHTAMEQVLHGRIVDRPVLSSEPAVLDYLRARIAFAPVEHFRVLFLNAANRLLADEEFAIGTVTAVHVYPREIVRRCLELGATAIVLAHNHPSGDPEPSPADRLMTDAIARAASCFDVVIHDHLVLARRGSVSFRRAGYL
ncbi:MAG: DNA repair protein RadC [Sphingomonadales bacterium]|nr:DNA repair protein RadC [Sphingomonadales bacterium]